MSDSWRTHLIPLEELLPELPRIELDEPMAVRVRHGNPIDTGSALLAPYCRLFHAGHLLAIARPVGNLLQPDVVLDPLP